MPHLPGRIYGYVIALLLLPALVLSRQDDVLFTPIGWSDAWFYFGYANNLVEFKRYLFRNFYYGTRLAWILPAHAVYSLFSPVTAAYVLHLLVWAVATLSFFFALRWIAGARSAFLTALLLGMHPWLWNSTGWNYPDGAAIAYALAAIALYTRAALQPPRRASLFMAGAAAAGALHCNFCWVGLGPVLPLTYIGLAYAWHKRSAIRSAWEAALWSGLGVVLLTALLGAVNYWLDGEFGLFGPSLRWARGLVSHPVEWTAGMWGAHGLPPWLWFGAAGILISAVLLPGRLRRGVRHSRTPALVCSLQLGLTLAVLAYMQGTGAPGLAYTYYACYLIPFTFLVVGTSCWKDIANLSARTYLPICVLAVAVFGFVWYAGAFRDLSAWLPTGVVAALILVILLAALFVRGAVASALLAIAAFGILTEQTRLPAASHLEARRNYQRLTRTRQRLELVRHGRRIDFWFDENDPEYPNNISLVSTYIYNQSFFSTSFPQLTCGPSTAPNTGVVVLSTREDAAELARRALADCWRRDGLLAQVEYSAVVEGVTRPYTVTAIFAAPDLAARRPLRAAFDAAGRGSLAPLDNPADSAPFPLDRWRVLPRTYARFSPAGLRVRTPRDAFAFALVYPPLVAPATARYSFTVKYQPGSGWFAFGLCQPGLYNWMDVGTSQSRFQPPGQVVVFADLKRGDGFELAIENNNNDGPGAASFAIQEVSAVILASGSSAPLTLGTPAPPPPRASDRSLPARYRTAGGPAAR
jgi:hypothetical protein